MDIYISHSGKDLVSPETGESGTLYDHRKEREWRHLDLFNWKCFIHCRIPRVQTPKGPKTISIPWADPSSRFTYGYECFAIHLLKATKNQTKTAEMLRCGINQVHRIMHRAVARGESRRSLADVRHISIDEKALKLGHSYATVVSDSDLGVVLDVGQGRIQRRLDRPIGERFRADQRSDRNGIYRYVAGLHWSCQTSLPQSHLDSRSVSFNPVSQ